MDSRRQFEGLKTTLRTLFKLFYRKTLRTLPSRSFNFPGYVTTAEHYTSEESFVFLPLEDKRNLSATQRRPLTVFPKPSLLIQRFYQKPHYDFLLLQSLHNEIKTLTAILTIIEEIQ